MGEPRFTKGLLDAIQTPWTYRREYCVAEILCPGNAFPWVMAKIVGPDEEQTEVYASLITSAPALYEALKEARGMLKHVQLDAPDDDDLQAGWDRGLTKIDAALSLANPSPTDRGV